MTDEEMLAAMKAEVAEARRILREDGHSVRLGKIEEKLAKAFPEPEPEPEPDGNPTPPEPKPEPGKSAADRPKRTGWWPSDAFPEAKPDVA